MPNNEETNGKSLTLGHSYGPSPLSENLGISKPQEHQPKSVDQLFDTLEAVILQIRQSGYCEKCGTPLSIHNDDGSCAI